MTEKKLDVRYLFHNSGSAEAKKAEHEVNAIDNALKKLVHTSLELKGASGGIGEGFSGLQKGLGAVAVAGLGIGLFAELEHLSSETAKLSTEVLLNSDKWRMNTEQTQTWMRVAEEAGVPVQKLQMSFAKFNQELFTGAPALAGVGLSLKSMGITSTDTSVAIAQAADYFKAHAGQVQLSTIAQQLFGRAGKDLIPILEQGSGTLSKFTEELKAHGLILNRQQLQFGALANVIHKDFTESLKGAQLQIGSGLQVGFIVLNAVMQKVIGEGSAGFQRLGTVVGEVVGFIAVLIGKLFGVSVNMTDILKQQNTALGAYSGLANKAADSTGQLANKTKDNTKALQDQIKEIHEQQKAYDASITAQTKAIDLTIREIDEGRRLRDEKKRASDDQKKIGKDVSDLNKALFEGDLVEAGKANDQLTTDKAAAAENQTRTAEDAHKNELNDAKAKLQDQKTAQDELYQSRIQQLQDQISAAQTSAAAQSSAFQSMAADGIKDFGAVGAAGDDLFTGLQKGIADSQGKFEGMFAELDRFLKDPGGQLGKSATELGMQIGKGIKDGLMESIKYHKGDMGSVPAFLETVLENTMGVTPTLGPLFGPMADAAAASNTANAPIPSASSHGRPAAQGPSVVVNIDARGSHPTEVHRVVSKALSEVLNP